MLLLCKCYSCAIVFTAYHNGIATCRSCVATNELILRSNDRLLNCVTATYRCGVINSVMLLGASLCAILGSHFLLSALTNTQTKFQ